MKKQKTPAKRKRDERDEKILSLFSRHKDNYEHVTYLYHFIEDKVGCSYGTVIGVLQKNGMIAPKAQ